ncbi:MAG: hypothetical protein GXP27_06720 [Planctomycetes bacterium]|nr:hypothetical protein [Planctomycetota bacterium]
MAGRTQVGEKQLRQMADSMRAVRRQVLAAWSNLREITTEASQDESRSGREAVHTISQLVTSDVRRRMTLCLEVLVQARNVYDHLTRPLDPENLEKLQREFDVRLRDARRLATEIERDAQEAEATLHRWLG